MFKKIVLASAILLFGFVSVSNAQMRSSEERAKQLIEQLKLDKDQAKKVEAIFKKQQEKMSKIFDEGGGFGNPSNRDKMMKLRDESNGDIMKILNNKQKTEFKIILDEQKKRMEERRKNMGNR